VLAVRGNTLTGVEVLISDSIDPASLPRDLITDRKWALLRGEFRQIDIHRMTGRNFTHKIELILAVFSGKADITKP